MSGTRGGQSNEVETREQGCRGDTGVLHGESITDQASPRTPTPRTFQPQEAVQPKRNQTILQADTPAPKANYSWCHVAEGTGRGDCGTGCTVPTRQLMYWHAGQAAIVTACRKAAERENGKEYARPRSARRVGLEERHT